MDHGRGLGDADTTCAVTGGVVAARAGLDAVPQTWGGKLREQLTDWAAAAEADEGPV